MEAPLKGRGREGGRWVDVMRRRLRFRVDRRLSRFQESWLVPSVLPRRGREEGAKFD